MYDNDWEIIGNLVHTICNSYITVQQEKNNIAAMDLAIRMAPASMPKRTWTMQEVYELAETIAVFIATGHAPKTEETK